MHEARAVPATGVGASHWRRQDQENVTISSDQLGDEPGRTTLVMLVKLRSSLTDVGCQASCAQPHALTSARFSSMR